VAGLVKALAAEWPTVRARVVDLRPGADPDEGAACLTAELFAADAEVEVGYHGRQRLLMRAQRRPLPASASRPLVGRDSVLLVTGGARGITCLAARGLAQRYRPTLVVVGRSRLPCPQEEADTAAVEGESALKSALIAARRAAGRPATAAEIEKEIRRILRAREVSAGLDALRASGARVVYRQADVRDGSSLRAVVEEIYGRYGRLDGVVHGAGVIADKLVEDTTEASFDEVFETKADPVFTLLGVLPQDFSGFVVFFSSVAGRFGNRGQAAYAAGNEAMAKMALAFRRRSARALVVHWGPWRGAGMVTPEIQRQFEERGIPLLDPAAAVQALDRELVLGSADDVEVILGPVPAAVAAAGTPAEHGSDGAGLPLLRPDEAAVAPPRARHRSADGWSETLVTLDAGRQSYLDDHRLDGRPVVPAAVALEMVAEAGLLACPGLEVAEVRDLQVLQGVVLIGESDRLRVAWRSRGHENGHGRREVDVVLTTVDASRIHYRARVRLLPALPTVPTAEPDEPSPADVGGRFPMPVAEAYERWLFHGPSLRCVRSIDSFGPWGIIATVDATTPADLLGSAAGDWVLDPALVDGAAQLVILWARAVRGITVLPAAIARFSRFAPMTGPVRCRLRVRPDGDPSTLLADASFVDGRGSVLARLEGLSCVGGESLNRLGGRRPARMKDPR
jgi:NAD(P)-dependent dehydrogenase (short-subunit alcohol dehydrogenase family)